MQAFVWLILQCFRILYNFVEDDKERLGLTKNIVYVEEIEIYIPV